jgi:hypothetical protein
METKNLNVEQIRGIVGGVSRVSNRRAARAQKRATRLQGKATKAQAKADKLKSEVKK